MLLPALASLFAAGFALPSSPSTSKGQPPNGFTDLPDSQNVIEALSNPEYYEQLSARFQQSPLQSTNIFKIKSSDATCGVSSICPAYEGKTETINGREYNLYCINAPWGTYFWLPQAKSLPECEASCHKNSYDCNGITFYPSTGACALIYSTDSNPYIWDNGYQKIGAIPVSNQPTAFPPGGLCPLPASDNQVWFYGDNHDYPFKISCLNSFQVPASAKKSLGLVGEVDECAIPCGKDKGCYGFHWYQASLVGGSADGKRTCEHIIKPVEGDQWTALYKPNQYMAGLKIDGDWKCGEPAWDQDNGCRVK
ncbi:MAG: hypothetical protein L6R40_004236 [Gallowayella cf. fulva]|nr:MAG: hypothetical protein L6R40_004236 [Xanthomendoza cf. fulva]